MIDVLLPHSSIIQRDYVGEGSADAGNGSWLPVSVLAVFSHDRELAEACLLIDHGVSFVWLASTKHFSLRQGIGGQMEC